MYVVYLVAFSPIARTTSFYRVLRRGVLYQGASNGEKASRHFKVRSCRSYILYIEIDFPFSVLSAAYRCPRLPLPLEAFSLVVFLLSLLWVSFFPGTRALCRKPLPYIYFGSSKLESFSRRPQQVAVRCFAGPEILEFWKTKSRVKTPPQPR